MTIRTGAEYLDSLKDGRVVYIDGEKVKDVTRDPRLRGVAHTIAEIYDLQHDDSLKDVLTFEDPVAGRRVPIAFLEPRSIEDLQKRQAGFRVVSDHTYGLLGRTPDFLNTVLTAMATAQSVFDKSASGKALGKNVRAYWEHCRDEDLAMTHVLVNPQVDRSKPVWDQSKDLAAKVVKETDAGFYVSGARLVGTLAQVSNEILNLPAATLSHDARSDPYTVGFAVPVATPGIKIISRPSLAPQRVGSFLDSPLSLRMDEGDAVVVFDNVFVPWERTFLYRDPVMANTYLNQAQALGHIRHHSMTHTLVKAEFMCGLAIRVAESTNVDEFPNVQNLLAKLLMHVDIADSILYTAVHRATPTPFGTFAPEEKLLTGLQITFYERLNEMIETLRTVGAGGLVGVPSYAELTGDLGGYVNQYFQSANSDADKRIRLLRLANDASISGFAGRLQLYEQYYQGDPYRRRVSFYKEHPRRATLAQRIDRIMDEQAERATMHDRDASST